MLFVLWLTATLRCEVQSEDVGEGGGARPLGVRGDGGFFKERCGQAEELAHRTYDWRTNTIEMDRGGGLLNKGQRRLEPQVG
jgi:hypothetical protein